MLIQQIIHGLLMVSLLPSFVARKKRYVSFRHSSFSILYYSLARAHLAQKGKKYYYYVALLSRIGAAIASAMPTSASSLRVSTRCCVSSNVSIDSIRPQRSRNV